MPTPPTTYVNIYPSGLGFTWGIPVAETGLNMDAVTNTAKCEEFQQKNSVGETIAVVTFNPTAEISLSGETMAAFDDIAGAPITPANLISLGGVSTGMVICKTIEITQGRAKMQTAKLTATRYPLIPAA
jgi:hypothetical protein